MLWRSFLPSSNFQPGWLTNRVRFSLVIKDQCLCTTILVIYRYLLIITFIYFNKLLFFLWGHQCPGGLLSPIFERHQSCPLRLMSHHWIFYNSYIPSKVFDMVAYSSICKRTPVSWWSVRVPCWKDPIYVLLAYWVTVEYYMDKFLVWQIFELIFQYLVLNFYKIE